MNPNNPYMQNPYLQQNMLPPQQILTAKGRSSIDKLRMSPNSSVLIADETAPIVWKCASDGIGNVTAEAFDITPHKDEQQIQQENMNALIVDISNRLKRLEENYESFVSRNNSEPHFTESRNNQASVGNVKKYGKPTSNDGANVKE